MRAWKTSSATADHADMAQLPSTAQDSIEALRSHKGAEGRL